MNSKTFIKVLREVISREVRKAIREELQSLNEQASPVNHHAAMNHGMRMHAQANKPAKKYTDNTALNSILNETAMSMRPGEMSSGGSPVEWESMPTMTSNNAMGFTPGMMQQSTPDVTPMTDINGQRVTELPQELTAAFTKDYSQLMKAIDKKKGN